MPCSFSDWFMVSNGCWPKLVPRHYGQTILESSSPNHHCQIQAGAQCFGSTPPHATADQMQSCPWIARRSSMNAYGICMLYIYIYVFMSVSVCMSTYVYLFISSHLSYVIHINPLKKWLNSGLGDMAYEYEAVKTLTATRGVFAQLAAPRERLRTKSVVLLPSPSLHLGSARGFRRMMGWPMHDDLVVAGSYSLLSILYHPFHAKWYFDVFHWIIWDQSDPTWSLEKDHCADPVNPKMPTWNGDVNTFWYPVLKHLNVSKKVLRDTLW